MPSSPKDYNCVSSNNNTASPTPDLVSSHNILCSSNGNAPQKPNYEQRDYVRVYNASGNGRALTHHVTKRNKNRKDGSTPGNARNGTFSNGHDNSTPQGRAVDNSTEDASFSEGKQNE